MGAYTIGHHFVHFLKNANLDMPGRFCHTLRTDLLCFRFCVKTPSRLSLLGFIFPRSVATLFVLLSPISVLTQQNL